jgi:hypothetical protein
MGGLPLLWAGKENNFPLPDDDGLLGSETRSLQSKDTIKKKERKTKPTILELPSWLFRNRRGVRTDELFCPRVVSRTPAQTQPRFGSPGAGLGDGPTRANQIQDVQSHGLKVP